MAKRQTVRVTRDLDSLFTREVMDGRQQERIVFACRQVAGPKPHGDLVVAATDPVDAHRQYFNYHGLASQTHRYRLKLVVVPEDHPMYEKAIECQSPRDDPGSMTLDQLSQQQFDHVESALKSPQKEDQFANMTD